MIPGIEDDLSEYLSRHPEDTVRLAGLRDRVRRGDDLSPRSDMLGHAVSSVMTIDRTRRRALLIHHRAYGLWIPPGGHHEPGETLYVSALRERREETGLGASRPVGGQPFILDIETHPIPERLEKGEGAHVHHDFMFLELVDEDFEPVLQEEEVQGCQWVPLDDLMASQGRMARLAARIASLPVGMLA